MFGGHMGNPNPQKQAYRCEICGADRPPYQFYCDRHLEEGERREESKGERPPLIDRIMRRIFGRS